jgi:glycosyltransferase involved in cell wall biosynthesis
MAMDQGEESRREHKRLRVALLAVDAREAEKDYSNSDPRFGTAVTALLRGLELQRDLETHVVSVARRSMAPEVQLAPNVWFHTLPVPHWAMMRSGYFGAILAIRRQLRIIRPDVVHGQGTERESALAAAYSGLPNAITIHGHMQAIASLQRARPFSFHWLAARLERKAIRKASGVICISSYTRAVVAPHARRSWLIPNAVDPAFFEIQRKPSSLPTLLCVGTIVAYKNQNALIRALDEVALQRRFKLLFIGAGAEHDPYFAEFKALVQSRPWCEARGFLDRESLRATLAESAALLLPSLEDNCPMVILEAMAAGLPVIASRIGGIPDLVAHEETGWLCDPSQHGLFADATLSLLSDPNLAARMGQHARAVAMVRFHPNIIGKAHVAAYRDLLLQGSSQCSRSESSMPHRFDDHAGNTRS